MNPRDAARGLLRELQAPSWAVSVAVWAEGGTTSLVVFVDPAYRRPLSVPKTFGGLPVSVRMKTPNVALV